MFSGEKTELFSTTKPNGKNTIFFPESQSVLAILYNNGICGRSEEQKMGIFYDIIYM